MKQGTPSHASGFTLIEVMVGISIIAILSFMAATSFPYIRQYQQATLTGQQIQSTLRRAQQLALDETRDENCLTQVGDEKELQRRCSDIGVAVTAGGLVMYADTADDNRFTTNRDFVLADIPLAGATSVTAKSFLFEATPPNIAMYVNGELRPATQTESLTVRSGRVTIDLAISPYGFISQTTKTP